MDILRRSLQPKPDKTVKNEPTLIGQVEDDRSLGSADDDTTTLPATLLDASVDTTDADDVGYKFVHENVTYRVVQFNDNLDTINANALTTTSTLSGSPSGGSSPQNATIYTTGPLSGVYVINSSDVFPENERPKTTIVQPAPKVPAPSRDDKRRITHNEVERRRRDKINNWIVKLGNIIPDCKSESSKGYEMHSKGGILAKACDYIVELRDTNERLLGFVKENQQLLADVQSLGRQIEELRRDNEQLRNALTENGAGHTVPVLLLAVALLQKKAYNDKTVTVRLTG